MLLYTIIPTESIFESETDNQEDLHDEIEIIQGKASLLIQSLAGGKYKITRIISTDPQDYLRPEWQPGRIISSL
jgi:hypothetical protein